MRKSDLMRLVSVQTTKEPSGFDPDANHILAGSVKVALILVMLHHGCQMSVQEAIGMITHSPGGLYPEAVFSDVPPPEVSSPAPGSSPYI